MKLLLASVAVSEAQPGELARLVGKDLADIKLALIENAADVYSEKSRGWVDENRMMIQQHGMRVEVVDLRKFVANRRRYGRNSPAKM